MLLHGVEIVDTFAEAFPMSATRLIVTATNPKWARIAADVFTGNATSVIACDCEAGLERTFSADESPDGRPGVALLVFAFSRDALAKAVANRVGQCILTCPTTACYNGIEDCPKEKQIGLGEQLRYFGDGFQISKLIGDRRFWRIPVMDGEFLVDHKVGTITGVAGGNLLLCGTSEETALAAAEAAADAIRSLPDVILPFPGGLVRSGSKVGSKYKGLKASTNDAYCPTIRPLVKSALPAGCNAVYEIVIDGLSFEAVQNAMRAGLHAAAQKPGLLQITAGNYGGKLGKHHLHLRDLL
jgi:formylmethanofuran--tetrahydromethanopterin N-formyltransferase